MTPKQIQKLSNQIMTEHFRKIIREKLYQGEEKRRVKR